MATLGLEADNVVSTMPTVTTSTEATCLGVYLNNGSHVKLYPRVVIKTDRFFTSKHPRTMLTIIPPLRKMMWTVMGISYAKAALLRVESTKKSAT